MTQLQRMIRLADLPTYVGLKRTQIDELIKAGEFPAAIKLSDGGRAKAWLESEVQAWQTTRILKSRDNSEAGTADDAPGSAA